MFPHVIKIGDKYSVRCLKFSGWHYLHNKSYKPEKWWILFPSLSERFDTPEEAENHYKKHKSSAKIVKFLWYLK